MMEYVSAFITNIIGFSMNIFIFHKITKEKIVINKINVLLIIFFSILLMVLNFVDPLMLKLICNIVCTCFLIVRFFNEEILKSFYYAFFIWACMLISDLLLSIIIMNNNLNFYDISGNFIIRSLLIIPLSLMQFFLVFINRKKIGILYDKYYIKISQNIYFVMCLMGLIFFIAFSCCLNLYISNYKYVSFFTISILVVVIVLVVYLIKYIIKSYNLQNINKNIIEENKLFREISKNDQIFKHNLINNLLGIESITNKKTKLLIGELINEYQDDYNKITNINELPQGIQGLIYKKIYLKNIKDLNVIVESEIKGDLSKIMSAKSYNLLNTALGILLDNALEAIENCSEKIILLNIMKENNYIKMVIKNSFTNVIDFEKIGKWSYTSKTSGHGYGLNYLLKNKSINLKTSIINNLYVVSGVIDIKK